MNQHQGAVFAGTDRRDGAGASGLERSGPSGSSTATPLSSRLMDSSPVFNNEFASPPRPPNGSAPEPVGLDESPTERYVLGLNGRVELSPKSRANNPGARREPFLIGVAGGTASGKTTVCDQIINHLRGQRVALISQDAFYRGLTEDEHRNVHDYNFDHPNAIDAEAIRRVLVELKAGKSVDIPIYDFKTHARAVETRLVNPSDVVIIEGILILQSVEVREMLNMKIFVDTDDDVRLARRIKRDTVERGRDVSGVIEQYTKFVKPMFDTFVLPSKKYADVIIPWARGDNTVAIDLIVQHIRTKLGQNDLTRIYPSLHVLPSNFQIRGMHTIIRDRNTRKHDFVFYADRLIRLVVEHGLGHLPFHERIVISPTGCQYVGVEFSRKVCGVSIIRSGESMENALRACMKGVKLGKILIHRQGDSGSRIIYERLPADIAQRYCLLLDPILATGNSAISAVEVLLSKGVPESKILFLSLIAAPEGIHAICSRFPRLQVLTSEIDAGLSETDLRVLPGVGEFGDRYFGTEEETEEAPKAAGSASPDPSSLKPPRGDASPGDASTPGTGALRRAGPRSVAAPGLHRRGSSDYVGNDRVGSAADVSLLLEDMDAATLGRGEDAD